MVEHQERFYRRHIRKENLKAFQITVQETDLHILADRLLEKEAIESVLQYRGHIEAYIRQYPAFGKTLSPWAPTGPAPLIVGDMIEAAAHAGVGPMAAVAGAISEKVAQDLLSFSKEVVVENGGDICLKLDDPATVGIYAGKSPLSMKIGVLLPAGDHPQAVCTSSGTVGHSRSFGKADAVCVLAPSCALADAAATAVGNCVQGPSDIRRAVDYGKSIPGLTGIVIVCGEKMGAWGGIEVVPIK